MAEYLLMDHKSEKEDYRYGERLVNPKLRFIIRPNLNKKHMEINWHIPGIEEGSLAKVESPINIGVNQVDEVIRKFIYAGEGTNQCTMEIAMPNDILLQDPPCLRLIDCRIRYGKLHFIVYFRSWDLYAGFPVNLGGLELLKQYMVDRINEHKPWDLENGSMVVLSKGLHIYEQYYELVESQLQLSLDELRNQIG